MSASSTDSPFCLASLFCLAGFSFLSSLIFDVDNSVDTIIKEGSFIEAVKYYIKGDMQVKAVNLIIKYRIKIDNNTLTYLMNSINELGLNDISKKLKAFMEENQ